MNRKNLKALYFEDHAQYSEVISGLMGMVSSICQAFDNGAEQCLSHAEQAVISNTYDRLRKFYDFASEVEEELCAEGWDTSYSASDQGYQPPTRGSTAPLID